MASIDFDTELGNFLGVSSTSNTFELKPMAHNIEKCDVVYCNECEDLRRVREEIHKSCESSSVYADVLNLMKTCFEENWSEERFMAELNNLKSFHDILWFEMKKGVFESLLDSIPHSSLKILPPSHYTLAFDGILQKWGKVIKLVFPEEHQGDILDYLCLHLKKPEYKKWFNARTVQECFKLLYNQQFVSSRALLEWDKEEYSKRLDDMIYNQAKGYWEKNFCKKLTNK